MNTSQRKKKEKKKRENKKHGCWLLSTKNTVIFAWNACAFYFYCCGEEQVNFYGHYIFAFTSIYFMLLVLVFPPSRRWERGGKRLLGILTYFSLGTMSALIKTRSSLLSAQRRTHKVSWQCEKLEGLVSCFFFFFFFFWDFKFFFPTQKKKKSSPCWFETPDGWKRDWRRASDATASWPSDLIGEWKRETKAPFFSGFGLQRGKIRAVFDRWDQIIFDIIFIQPAGPETFRRFWEGLQSDSPADCTW